MSSGPAQFTPRRRFAVTKRILRALFALGVDLTVTGRENIPAQGGVLLIFNHLSNADPLLLLTLMERADATGLVAANYRDKPLHRLVLESGGGMWLRRGEGDRAALEQAIELLRAGWLVGIAPEGGRSRNGAMREAKRGAAFLAHQANVPILPVGVAGTESLPACYRRLRRPRVQVAVGSPFRLPELQPGNHKQQLEAHTEQMMRAIAELLPAQYHGVYGQPGDLAPRPAAS
jgi:1-acyl-sn-glycerol-3-phosphate acyltransferase